MGTTMAMQWDHLRVFEAVARLGSLSAAARALGVSQSTVSRQLSALEGVAGSALLLREVPVRPTPRGAALLAAVQPMVDAALAAEVALAGEPELRGQVTVTTVGELLRWSLSAQLGQFCRSYPQLRLRILSTNQVSSLAAGEADLALRFARPQRGDLVARRLSTTTYGYFVARSLALEPTLAWLGLTGSLARIPEQRYAERAFCDRPARLLVEDLESLGLLVAAGLGVAILPRQLSDRLPGVVEVEAEQVGAAPGPIPSRDMWMIVHRAKQREPKVRAVMRWLEGIDWLYMPLTINQLTPSRTSSNSE